MKRLLIIAASLLGVLGMTFAIAPAASAYPELTCNVTVEPQTVEEGDPITVTASVAVVETGSRVSAIADETEWTITFNGDTRTGTGATLVETFTAPDVSSSTVFAVTASGTNEVGTCVRNVDVTVLPGGTDTTPPDDGLPGTGGPALILLLGGLALLAVGAIAVRQSRRSHTS